MAAVNKKKDSEDGSSESTSSSSQGDESNKKDLPKNNKGKKRIDTFQKQFFYKTHLSEGHGQSIYSAQVSNFMYNNEFELIRYLSFSSISYLLNVKYSLQLVQIE